MDSVPIADFHARIVRDTFGRDLSDDDAMLLFSILHCYEIKLAGPVLSDCPSLTARSGIAAITQRDCGEALAAIWAGTDDRRADYMYWYYRWQDWGSYPRFDDITPDERIRMRQLIQQLTQHPFVAGFVPEDWDPAAIDLP